MRVYLDCIPCFLSQTLEACKFVSDDKEVQYRVLKKVMKFLLNISLDKTPPEISKEVHRIIREETGSEDPYREAKRRSNELAKSIYPNLKKMVSESEDPLLTSVKLAIAGNAIDFGTMTRFNIEDVVNEALEKDIDERTFQKFREDLKRSRKILYLSDNAGEVFFDKILIEELRNQGKEITFAVKSNPIINDATIEDAIFAGINEIADVMEGDKDRCSAPGFILDNVTEEFSEKFENSDIVISKGQGNYEALSDVDRKIYFLLLVKCPLVARDLGSKIGDYVIRVNL